MCAVSKGNVLKSLKVGLVAPLPPPYGGIAHWTGLVTRHAATRSDIEIHMVDTAPRWRSIHNVGVIRRIVGGGAQMLRDLARLARVLFVHRIDVIHLTTSGHLAAVRDIFVLALAYCVRVPLVYHIRFGRIPVIAAANSLEWRLMAFVCRKAFAVIAIDDATGASLTRMLPEASIYVIPNCVDFDALPTSEAIPHDRKEALFLGWVVPSKGIRELVQAWDRVSPKGWTLKVAGPSNPAFIQSLEVSHRLQGIEFVGELDHDDAMLAMARCDVFVLPSHTEGFPNVVLEAMALGKPIIATRVGAIPAMLEDGESGLLVPPKDTETLAEALTLAIADPERRSILGGRARKRALEFYSLNRVFDTYLSLWNFARSGTRISSKEQ